VVDEPGEPEVTELGGEGRVEHHVAGLDVPVENALLPILMQVQQCRADPEHNLTPEKWSN
jgi:hypothetical protein